MVYVLEEEEGRGEEGCRRDAKYLDILLVEILLIISLLCQSHNKFC